MYQGKKVLDIMSKYATNRNRVIEEFIVRYFNLNNTGDKSILEFGAGTGEFIDRLKRFSHLTTYAVEIDDTYREKLSQNHHTYRSVLEIPKPVDYIFTIDVLEHIEDDEAVLRDLYASLSNDGTLLIYVPARAELYSKFDESIGHYRRYGMGELRDKVLAAGFKITESRYSDFLGYFAACFNKLTSDGSLNVGAVRIYDAVCVPITRVIESILAPPIGKNILLVAKK